MPTLQGDAYLASYQAPGGSLQGATVTLTATAPDSTVTTPAVTVNAAAGTATATVPATQLGDWLLVWSASAPALDVEVDQFSVTAPRLQLLNLADLRDELNLATADRAVDAKLRRWIAAVARVVENVCGPVLPADRTDVFDGGVDAIVLPFRWVRSITSITETRGATNYPLTEQPLGASVSPYGYTWDRSINRIVRRGNGGGVVLFAPGDQAVTVKYVLGMTAVPSDIQLGATEIIAHWYRRDEAPGNRGGAAFPGDETDVTAVGNYLVPNAAMELLRPWARRPGIF